MQRFKSWYILWEVQAQASEAEGKGRESRTQSHAKWCLTELASALWWAIGKWGTRRTHTLVFLGGRGKRAFSFPATSHCLVPVCPLETNTLTCPSYSEGPPPTRHQTLQPDVFHPSLGWQDEPETLGEYWLAWWCVRVSLHSWEVRQGGPPIQGAGQSPLGELCWIMELAGSGGCVAEGPKHG